MAIDSGAVGLVGVAVAMLVEVVGMAFWAGLISSRVKALEAAVAPIASLRTDMAALTERMETLIDLLRGGEAPRVERRRGPRSHEHG